MPGNQVLKITTRSFAAWRPHQSVLHVIEKGRIDLGEGLEIYWYTQPRAETPVTESQRVEFQADLTRQRVELLDLRAHKLGIYNGAVKALDPFALRKLA